MLDFPSNLARSNLHFGEFQRVVISFPRMPVDGVSIGDVRSSVVETVKVGVVASTIPPLNFCAQVLPGSGVLKFEPT